MKTFRKKAQIFCIFSTMLMVLVSVPFQPVFAALIGTETVLTDRQAQDARDYLRQTLAREDVRSALIAQGIDPLEAQIRVESMTDSEVVQLAEQIENLPAGGGAIGFAIGVLVIVLLIVVIAKLI